MKLLQDVFRIKSVCRRERIPHLKGENKKAVFYEEMELFLEEQNSVSKQQLIQDKKDKWKEYDKLG